jgi:hypothetical protein
VKVTENANRRSSIPSGLEACTTGDRKQSREKKLPQIGQYDHMVKEADEL